MSCVEKRHGSHRAGNMPHHRFPNGFAELLMDENDHEVSTLTDRAFRSLCVGDDAIYNDESSYGYSPFSCHKPLVEEPAKKAHHKDAKKQGHNGTNDAQPLRQQQQKSMSHVSSFLKAFSATEKSCEGMLIKNGDSNGESWDKSALRSIQRELSEFSTDYHSNLADGHFSHNKGHHRHSSGDGSAKKAGKDAALPMGKASKTKNGKSTIKLRKLNIKNFFLHSEFSPFQTWRDFNSFPFAQEDIVTSILPTDNLPKWYDSPLYKQLTEAHRIETLQTEETQECQKAVVEPPPPPPKPVAPPPPPKVLPKPSATLAEQRCSSERGEGSAPWRRNKSRAQSAVPVNLPVVVSPPQGNSSKTVEESLLSIKKEAKSVEVKAIEEVNSLASTPFSICQLMTPLIPSRQPTETSEILQSVFSPSALDLPLRPDSEAKLTPEPPVKRDSYKSLASSILFNLKDNRKRVKSRYSPPKFRTSELADRSTQSPRLELAKHAQACLDGTASGFSTPAILKDGQPICSPITDPANTPTVVLRKYDTDRPISDDYLISNLLQTKREAAGSTNEENNFSPFAHSKKDKSPLAIKQNYPSLNLYKKASPVDNEMKRLQFPLTTDTLFPINEEHPTGQNIGCSPHAPIEELSPNTISGNKGLSPNIAPENKGLSPNIAPENKGLSPNIAPDKGLSLNVTPVSQGVSPNILPGSKGVSPYVPEKEGLSPNLSVGKGHSPNVPDNVKRAVKDFMDTKEKYFGAQPVVAREKDMNSQPKSTMDVIKAAREAITAAKNKALSATQSDSTKRSVADTGEPREKEIGEDIVNRKEVIRNSGENSVTERNNVLSPSRTGESDTAIVNKNSSVKREPPPVPKRSFAKSDIKFALDAQQTANVERLSNGDIGNEKQDLLVPKEKESVRKQGRFKHIFSARQNNYIKSQRYVMTEDEREEEYDAEEPKENAREDEVTMSPTEMKDSGHIINDLHALKELERVRLGDRVLENARNKLAVFNIDEETKAKNDLISKELRNIKRGMLSMRANTFSKRDAFAKKEQEQSKHDMFTKIDSNVIVNKAVINDNYDKAKMALEEIISERLKYKSGKEEDVNSTSEENAGEESYVKRVQQGKTLMQDSMVEAEEIQIQNGGMSVLREKEMREKLRDLRGNKYLKQILSQAEAKLGGKMPLAGMDRGDVELNKFLTNKYKFMKEGHDKLTDKLSHVAGPEEENTIKIARRMSDENGDDLMKENGGGRKKRDAPPVPPRSRKGSVRSESVSNETERTKDVVEGDIADRDGTDYNVEAQSVKEVRSAVLGKYEPDSEMSAKETATNQNKISLNKDMWGEASNAKVKDSDTADVYVSPTRETKYESNNSEPEEPRKVKRKAPLKPDVLNALEQEKTNAADDTVTKTLAAEEPDKTNKATEAMNLDEEALNARKIISPLLQLNGININCQSPPDHSSLSSKSSYFSAESALHRNMDTESNVYHSMENLIGELDEADGLTDMNISGNLEKDSERAEMEYYSLSDHESEADADKQPVVSPHREQETSREESGEHGDREVEDVGKTHCSPDTVNDQKPKPPSNTFSPTLGIPALFKVKNNTNFSSKVVKPVQPWSPRESLSGSEKGEEELYHLKEIPEVPLTDEVTATTTTTTTSSGVTTPDANYEPKETLTHHSPLALSSLSNLLKENPKESQFGAFLTVPQEDNRNSDVSPLSEEAESLAASMADTGDELLSSAEAGNEVSKVPSERSGSTCSGNDSQTGLPKPPAVLPKSEKALLKAMKLTTRRIKKEEAQNKSSHKSSRSGSKHKANKQRSDNSEHKSSEPKSSSSRGGSSGDKHHSSSETHHRERTEQRQHRSENHSERTEHGDKSEQSHHERKGHSSEKQHHNRSDHTSQRRLSYDSERLLNVSTERQRSDHTSQRRPSYDSERLPNVSAERQGSDHTSQRRLSYDSERLLNVSTERQRSDHTSQRRPSYDSERLPNVSAERQGRNSEKHIRDKPEHRDYSSDRVISDVPVYKAHVAERPMSDRQYQRSQSIDRYLGDKVEHRLSTDMAANDRLDPRSQRIEKSIMDELQQRGRVKDRAGRDNLVKRSHSIDTYASEVSHPPSLSRQSSHTSQLSRQSSVEHTIVTQSFPMTQRKLLQDPDSGQYFFVDMPVQVKTKTFFDPETGNYVQLPVQPPEGAVPQASPIEVLNTPVVLYHGFVPVPLSSMAQHSAVQVSQMEQEEFEQRHVERLRQMHSKEGRPYLEPVYGQQDHMLGEFLGTEELDCVS